MGILQRETTYICVLISYHTNIRTLARLTFGITLSLSVTGQVSLLFYFGGQTFY